MNKTAVTVYIDNDPNIITEFGWLYRSWLYSGSWRTSDIVAFYNPAISLERLPKDVGIIYVPVQPLSDLKPEWESYKFINSIYYLTTPDAVILTDYKYVLRTDCDCFLTPYFQSFKPRLATFGVGLYTLDPAVAVRLSQIAQKWGIMPVFNSVGSTIMAYSHMVLQYSQLQMEYCRKLKAEEFMDGIGTWPGWYFGVLSMYAGQLAANSLFGIGMTLGGLDVHCMSPELMCPTDYHIHAWHTYDYFSKFKWRNGEYKEVDMNKLNHNCISDYCLWIAGSGPEVIQ